jgi:hypothetical protein
MFFNEIEPMVNRTDIIEANHDLIDTSETGGNHTLPLLFLILIIVF